MVEADIAGDLKAFIAKVDASGIPNQLLGYLSTLAGPGADMVPSADLIPELQSIAVACTPPIVLRCSTRNLTAPAWSRP